jgi:lysozyme
MMRFLLWAIAAILIGACLGWAAISWRPSVENFPIQGVDVDQRDGPIDWFTLKGAGADFGYARATIGATGQDLRFADHWMGMQEAGVRRGAIHVFSLCAQAADQAANFVRTVPRSDDQLPAAVRLGFRDDCPARPQRDVVIGEVTRLLMAIETHSSTPTLLMLEPPFEEHYRIAAAIPRNLWGMRTFVEPDYLPRPWRMWRASGIRRAPGVDGLVHWNVVAR